MTAPALSDRTRRILATLVRSYIETGEPVSSATLAHKAGLNLSSATVRNVLAQLEDMGFVYQPHTSAGRVPTDSGYRFYVDLLLEGRRAAKDLKGVEARLRHEAGDAPLMDDLLSSTSHVLSEVSKHVGFAIAPPNAQAIFHRIEFVPLSGARILIVVVASGNQVSQKTVDIGEAVRASELVQAANYLNAEFSGPHARRSPRRRRRSAAGRAVALRSAARPRPAAGQHVVREPGAADGGVHRRHLDLARRGRPGQRHLGRHAAHVASHGRRKAAARAHADRIHRRSRA